MKVSSPNVQEHWVTFNVSITCHDWTPPFELGVVLRALRKASVDYAEHMLTGSAYLEIRLKIINSLNIKLEMAYNIVLKIW